MKTFKHLTIVLFFLLAISSCTNVYYVGELNGPSRVFYSIDTLYSQEGMNIPINEKVLIKKKRKNNVYNIIYKNHQGYIFKPNFSYYRKFNYEIDGNLYGYSNRKSNSGSSYNSRNSSTGGSVYVKGYRRKDGTYVKPHTRKK